MGAYNRYMGFALCVFFFFSMPQASASHDFSTYKRTTDTAQTDGHAHMQPVRPHWIARSNKFWFRRTDAPGESTFVYVDPNQGQPQPAFDHAAVATALRQQGVEASAANLPFEWIDVSENRTSVKFRAGQKNWEWTTKDGVLTPFDGDISEEELKPLTEERPSTRRSAETAIRFINLTKERVSLYWIDASGKDKHYQDIEAGETATQHTYEGHVWRVTRAEDGETIASFAAASEEKAAVIKKGLPVAKPQLNSLSKRQSNGTTDGSGIFFRDNNVWFRDANGQETQMSTTGTEASPFSNFTYSSPDNKFLVAMQSTPEQEHTVYAVESSPTDQVQPRLHQWQYLKPGDNVTIDRPRMFDLTTKQEIPTDDALFHNPYQLYALDGGWNAEGTEFRFLYNQRGHQVVRIVGMSTQGKVRAIVEESSNTFIDYAFKLYYRPMYNSNSSSELIWASERDGRNHLYMYDMQRGQVTHQITRGDFVVRSVDSIDEAKRQIWLKVLGAVPGQDPYYAHLARVNFDGTGFTLLTEGDGTHEWYWSADRTAFTDTWSRMDLAYHSVLRDADTGNATVAVTAGNLDAVLYPVPERFAAPGRDNATLIYGLIFRPTAMDNDTAYPVIERIYAGPHDFFVPKAYTVDTEAHALAEQGFVVVLIDGMGTNWRARKFHDVAWKNLKDAGFPDRIAWMKAAASTRPWMDISRVGVYGSSAGGQNAMGALLFHNDFYSVAAADCGCHDNRMDKLWWNEAWMGYPVDRSYEDSSNVVHAGRLEGKLLLSVGELDTNVDPASTMQVVDALNRAGKEYELLVVPGGEHGVAILDEYAARRTREFLYRGLKGGEMPKE